MYHQLSHLHTMRNYEFMYSIKSRDITHSITLFYKTTDSKNQFLYLKKIHLKLSISMQLKCFDIKQVAVPRLLIYS
jgi:hypothetical protein